MNLAWTNISVHALNTVFALFEIGCTNSPPSPWLTLPACILVLAGYLGIAYITHVTQGFYSTFPVLFCLFPFPSTNLYQPIHS